MTTAAEAARGWDGGFPHFGNAQLTSIVDRLREFLPDASPEQVRAWKDSIPKLQREVGEVIQIDTAAGAYTAVLEYQLPMDSRRIDAVLLVGGSVVVIELKGKLSPTDADIDQAHAYARDLRCYHAACDGVPVHAVLVPTRATGRFDAQRGVLVCGPDALDELVNELRTPNNPAPVTAPAFLAADSYRPLPTLVKAARELLESGTVRRVHRAAAATDGACAEISAIVQEAAATGTRRLVLLTGVPGAGKTLVGLRVVHAKFIDNLAVARKGVAPTTPAVFLSGNGPLVEVLQHELRGAGGGGRTFVRGVKEYVKRYDSNPALVPPEHVLVFDEAQRAYDAAMVAEKQNTPLAQAKSEPEHFVEFAERIPDWCVVVGLIGGGQEIHKGEEAGLKQWATAIAGCADPSKWTVHCPPAVKEVFTQLPTLCSDELSLNKSLRSHLAEHLHKYVAGLVQKTPANASHQAALASTLLEQGHDLRICRDKQKASEYLRSRYGTQPDARYGLLASSRDRSLTQFDINNDFQSTKRVRFGPWYGDSEQDPGGRSGRHLRDCVTEFGAQGLELDAVLLAWGTDFMLVDGTWSNKRMAQYQKKGAAVRDGWQLRSNAYRVLLTRSRDATVVFVPQLPELNATYEYLVAAGFRPLTI